MKRVPKKPSSVAPAELAAAANSPAKRVRRARAGEKKREEGQKRSKLPQVPADGLPRCQWAGTYTGAAAADYIRYHDEEWGRPVYEDKQLFELLILEGAQAGLSWSTILAKREAYRAAFQGFDPAVVAGFSEAQVAALMAEGSGVVRNRAKLASTVQNAKVFLRLQQEHGSFSQYVWGFVPNRQPIVNSWSSMTDLPTKTTESEALSKALKAAGMNFVGPTIMYAFMQAAGLVNDHVVGCHCYQEIIDSYGKQQQTDESEKQQEEEDRQAAKGEKQQKGKRSRKK